MAGGMCTGKEGNRTREMHALAMKSYNIGKNTHHNKSSVRPNIVPYGTFGGRKWWNIPAEDCSIIFFLSSGITGIFLFGDI